MVSPLAWIERVVLGLDEVVDVLHDGQVGLVDNHLGVRPMSGRMRVGDVLETVWTVTKVPAMLLLVVDLGERIPGWCLAEVGVLGLDVMYQPDDLVGVVGRVGLDLEVHRCQGH